MKLVIYRMCKPYEGVITMYNTGEIEIMAVAYASSEDCYVDMSIEESKQLYEAMKTIFEPKEG